MVWTAHTQPVTATERTKVRTEDPMTNRYAAACVTCGATVPAHGGALTKQGRRWVVRHLACEDG